MANLNRETQAERRAAGKWMRQSGLCVAMALALLAAGPSLAQDAPTPPAPASTPGASAPAAPAPSAPAASSAPSAEPAQPAPQSTAQPPSPASAGPSSPTPEPASPTAAPASPAVPASVAPAEEPAGAAMPGALGTATLPHDLSPWGMFMAADIVVKSVMVALAVAAASTWVIWLAKTLELVGARSRIRRGLSTLEGAEGLGDLEGEMERRFRRGPVAAFVRSAIHEKKRSADLAPEGIKERVAISLNRIEARAGRNMARGTGILATIGSISPFVGLFGTVWGIMNSFIGISQSNTTNLAVVAPGIAEALLATAVGLVAAIPAVVFYNVFSRAIGGYRTVLSDASAEVMRHLSRDLDRERHRAAASTPPKRQRLEAAE